MRPLMFCTIKCITFTGTDVCGCGRRGSDGYLKLKEWPTLCLQKREGNQQTQQFCFVSLKDLNIVVGVVRVG